MKRSVVTKERELNERSQENFLTDYFYQVFLLLLIVDLNSVFVHHLYGSILSVLCWLKGVLLKAIHMDDTVLLDRLIIGNQLNGGRAVMPSDSVGSTQTLSDLAQRRHGIAHRRSNVSTHAFTIGTQPHSLPISEKTSVFLFYKVFAQYETENIMFKT